jgi:hypothetical protein
MFAAALESMGKPPFSIGHIAPTARLVDQFFNDSTGQGDQRAIDTRGPWNEGEQSSARVSAWSRAWTRRSKLSPTMDRQTKGSYATYEAAEKPGLVIKKEIRCFKSRSTTASRA